MRTQVKDKYGKWHPSDRDAEFANRCYDFMEFLTNPGNADGEGLNMVIFEAEKLCAGIILNTPEGNNIRRRLKSFIQLTEIYYLKQPGQI